MSDQPTSHPVDRLVLRHLELQASRLPAEDLTRRVLEHVSSEQPVPHSAQVQPATTTAIPSARLKVYSWKRTIGIAATILTVTFAFVIGRWDTPAQAEPDRIVRAAISTHAEPIERCYLVTIDPGPVRGSNIPAFRDVRVWTQGDRFWVDVNRGDRNWAWGRTVDGNVWLTLGPKRAIRIEADEIGTPLTYLCDLYSLELESLLTSVLNDFELHRREGSETTHVITARPRQPDSGRVRELQVEFDKDTKAVRRLDVQRMVQGQLPSKITFTLVDTRTPDQAMYQPEGHLEKPYLVLTARGRDDGRRRWLTSWFGPEGSRWIRSASSDRP